MSFGQQLAAVRRQTGLTQEQFAEELCVSRQAVSKWESGRGFPEMEKIIYICNRYHVTLDTLFAEEVPAGAAAEAAETAKTPDLPRATLQGAFTAFLTNLSPKNKWLAAGVLLGVAALAGIIGLFLKGGNSDMATTIWIAAIIVFGVVEAATAGLTSIWFVLGSVAALIAAKENGKKRDLPEVRVAGYTDEGRAASVQIANTKMAEKDWFSDANLRTLFDVSVNTPYNWRQGKAAPEGFAEAFAKKDVKKMLEVAKKYKANRGRADAMNTKGVERNLPEEQMHKQRLK